jgi:hypothetical protein
MMNEENFDIFTVETTEKKDYMNLQKCTKTYTRAFESYKIFSGVITTPHAGGRYFAVWRGGGKEREGGRDGREDKGKGGGEGETCPPDFRPYMYALVNSALNTLEDIITTSSTSPKTKNMT